MNILNWVPWWVPTKEDKDKWAREDRERACTEYPIEFAKYEQENKLYIDLLSKLEDTFSEKQKELYMQAKIHAQNAHFHYQRFEYLTKKI